MDERDWNSNAENAGSPPDFGALYAELRRLAQRRLADLPPGQTLQPTALVHEAWLRIAGRTVPIPPGDRSPMFVVARAMRDLLVEDARRKATLKRASPGASAFAHDVDIAGEGESDEVLEVHEALAALERESPEAAQVVELRYFVGLTVPEVADTLLRSVSTIERQWAYARAWLRRRLDQSRLG